MKKFASKMTAVVAVMSFVLGTVLVASPETVAAKKVKVKKVTVKAPLGKTAYVAKGKKVKLTTTVKVKPNKKANKKVTYKSMNKGIAKVNAKGVLKGVKPGKTKIVVVSKKNKKKKASIKVVVKKAAVKKVKLNSKNFVLPVGGKKTLKASVTPKKNTSSKVVWSSSNKKVVSVSSKGVVKGLKDGKAKITAKAADGSNKKASVTVTVGAGIAHISAVNTGLLRVTLTSPKALSTKDFVVQKRSGPTSSVYRNVEINTAESADQKVYYLDLFGEIWEGSYVKVTIPSLATMKTAEIFVEKFSDYGDSGNEEVTYVTGNKDTDTYSSSWFISNSNSVGDINYTGVSGLPSGLKAYISRDKLAVRVEGKYNQIEKGTTATLTGTDEKGTTFTKKYVFVIGSDNQLVIVTEPIRSQLTYHPDDPKTIKDEESGFRPTSYNIDNYLHIGGGTDDYDVDATYNGKDVSSLMYDEKNYKYVAVKPGTYNIDVTVTDDENPELKATSQVTLNLQEGVTVSGSVYDAAGQPVKGAEVCGYTKSDAYGRSDSLFAWTEMDGTYTTRVIPGDYYTFAYAPGSYEQVSATADNKFYANATKNYKIPLYRVQFALNVPGAAGYDYPDIYLRDSYGSGRWINTVSNWYDRDHSMYAYLRAGSYEVVTEDEDTDADVKVYGSVTEDKDAYGNNVYELENFLGNFKVSGSFYVSGNGTVTLNAQKVTE